MALKFIRLKFDDTGQLVKALPSEEGINCVEVIEDDSLFSTRSIYYNDLDIKDSDTILKREINISKSTNKSVSFILAIQTKGVYKLAINFSCLAMELCRNNKNPSTLGFQRFDIPTINSQKEIHSMNQFYVKLYFKKAATGFNPTELTSGQLYLKQGSDYYTSIITSNNFSAANLFYHRNVSEFKEVDNVLCKSNYCGLLSNDSSMNAFKGVTSVFTEYNNNYVLSFAICYYAYYTGGKFPYDSRVVTGYVIPNFIPRKKNVILFDSQSNISNFYFLSSLVNTVNKSTLARSSKLNVLNYSKDLLLCLDANILTDDSFVNRDITLSEVSSITHSNFYIMSALSGKVHNYFNDRYNGADRGGVDPIGIIIQEHLPSRKNGVDQWNIGTATELTYKYIDVYGEDIKYNTTGNGSCFINIDKYNTQNNIDIMAYGGTISNLKSSLYYNNNTFDTSKYKYNYIQEYTSLYDNNNAYINSGEFNLINSSTPNVSLLDKQRTSNPLNFSYYIDLTSPSPAEPILINNNNIVFLVKTS